MPDYEQFNVHPTDQIDNMFEFNPLLHSVPSMSRSAKNVYWKKNHKKNPMSVATMSRYTVRAYFRLCPEKRQRKGFGQ